MSTGTCVDTWVFLGVLSKERRGKKKKEKATFCSTSSLSEQS